MAGRNPIVRFGLIVCCFLLSVARLQAVVPWTPFGPDGGDARRIAVDPHDAQHLFLGTANGWMYESHTGGNSWRRLARVGKRDDLVLDSIAVDPRDSKHIVVGAWTINHPDGGIYLSEDGGASWRAQAEMRGQSVRSLAIAPSDASILVAGTLQGVFRSNDGGLRWSRISPEESVEIHNVQSVAIDPTDPNVIYAGTFHLPWKTTDGGEHWDNIKKGIIDDSDVFSIVVDPEQPKIVYASACSGIYKSEDAGDLFHKIQGIPSTARRTRRIIEDPGDLKVVLAGTTEGLWRSEDAGKTWVQTTGSDIVVNDVVVDPKNSKRILLATDHGGVMASDDGGTTFHDSNNGFSARQITALIRDPQRPDTIYVGIVNDKHWGGVFESDNGGIDWLQRADGLDGRDVFSLGEAPDGTLIAGTAHGLFRFDRAGEDWLRLDAGPATAEAKPRLKPVVGHRPATKKTVATHRTATVRAKSKAHTVVAKSRKPAPPTHKAVQETPAEVAHTGTSLLPPAETTAGQEKLAATATPAAAEPPGVVPAAPVFAGTAVEPAPAVDKAQVHPKGFNGSVYGLATAGDVVLASTSGGLLVSTDNGVSWQAAGPEGSADWRFLAAAKNNVVAASLTGIAFSPDAGTSWSPVPLPEKLKQVSALAVEPSGQIWVGGREGLFVSRDAGVSWSTPKDLFVSSVSNLYYDPVENRVLVTTAGTNSFVFTVQLPERKVAVAEVGWSLRFARPLGDHLIAATLFDGVVIQPRMTTSPIRGAAVNAAATAENVTPKP